MIDMEEINKEIKKLEDCDCMTWSVCEKLAILYIVRKYFNEGNMDNRSMSVASMSMGIK